MVTLVGISVPGTLKSEANHVWTSFKILPKIHMFPNMISILINVHRMPPIACASPSRKKTQKKLTGFPKNKAQIKLIGVFPCFFHGNPVGFPTASCHLTRVASFLPVPLQLIRRFFGEDCFKPRFT